jgi:chemotaxis response regulator CheB
MRPIAEVQRPDRSPPKHTVDRSAKQDPKRRFHALCDKLTRRDVMWKAWVDVATNQGAPGVDQVTITSIAEGGTEAVRAFLEDLAKEVEAGT